MTADGYKGGAGMEFITISEDAGNEVWVKTGHSSATVEPAGTNEGFLLKAKDHTWQNGFDAGLCWIYTADAYDIGVTSHSNIGFGV